MFVQFSDAWAMAFLKTRIWSIACIRASCCAFDTVFKFAVQKLIADVCVQRHVTPPYITKCSNGIIRRIGASAKMAILRLLEALEHADTRKDAFAAIPKNKNAAFDEEVLARCMQVTLHSDAESQRCASALLQCWSGEAHCVQSGAVFHPLSNSSTSVTTIVESSRQESNPDLKAVVNLENALGSDRVPDPSVLAIVRDFVQRSSGTSAQELSSILSGLEGPADIHEFQRSAWRLCKWARNCSADAIRSKNRSRSPIWNQKGDANKGKGFGVGDGAFGHGAKSGGGKRYSGGKGFGGGRGGVRKRWQHW